MGRLNYQHLEYFWVVAREGSVTAAAKTLFVTPSTVSVQLKKLQDQFEQPLFKRAGRGLELTEVGQVAFRYAESIFSTGVELEEYLEGKRRGGTLRLNVGVAHSLPKLVTWQLLEPVTRMEEPCHIVCREASSEELVNELALHQLDLVLSDTPLKGGPAVRLVNNLLGECGVSIFATPELAAQLPGEFPRNLNGVDFVLPSSGSEMRRSLDAWFSRIGVRPRIVAEFDDLALMKVAGEHGLGVVPVPEVVSHLAETHYGVQRLGRAEGVVERFFAVSAERQVDHPAVVEIAGGARVLLDQE
ncbi:MAG: transcriptional activator NhaR [Myxococcales bacterium]|nr:transcriptional activator NhaR [Myxococcales bacterium]